MAAPKGNRFWMAAVSPGRKPIFKSPENLWECCLEYFEWNAENPLEEAIVHQGVVNKEEVKPLMRAMSLDALCVFLEISRRCWDSYRDREEFLPVVTRVEQVIRSQKFEGASAGLLNPSIIARDLGLADKKELDHTNSDGSLSNPTIDPTKLSPGALLELEAAMLAAVNAKGSEPNKG